jgi:hypothetical protein
MMIIAKGDFHRKRKHGNGRLGLSNLKKKSIVSKPTNGTKASTTTSSSQMSTLLYLVRVKRKHFNAAYGTRLTIKTSQIPIRRNDRPFAGIPCRPGILPLANIIE